MVYIAGAAPGGSGECFDDEPRPGAPHARDVLPDGGHGVPSSPGHRIDFLDHYGGCRGLAHLQGNRRAPLERAGRRGGGPVFGVSGRRGRSAPLEIDAAEKKVLDFSGVAVGLPRGRRGVRRDRVERKPCGKRRIRPRCGSVTKAAATC
jgi:hypothetical protein